LGRTIQLAFGRGCAIGLGGVAATLLPARAAMKTDPWLRCAANREQILSASRMVHSTSEYGSGVGFGREYGRVSSEDANQRGVVVLGFWSPWIDLWGFGNRISLLEWLALELSRTGLVQFTLATPV